MYSTLEGLPLGNFSQGWVIFNNGFFQGKPTLIKYIAGMQKGRTSFRYLNDRNYEIPFVALNPLVAETISRIGDPTGKVAEYFLAKQSGQLYICTPSFIEERRRTY